MAANSRFITPSRPSSIQRAKPIRSRIAKGTTVHADEASAWDHLHVRLKRINHQEAYSLDGACTNMAEEYFSWLRRGEIGIHHHIAAPAVSHSSPPTKQDRIGCLFLAIAFCERRL